MKDIRDGREQGPVFLMKGGETVPTDFFGHVNLQAVKDAAEAVNSQPEEVMSDGSRILPDDHREFLENIGSAGQKLLQILERNPNNGLSEEARQVLARRAVAAGLHPEAPFVDSGWMGYLSGPIGGGPWDSKS